MEVYSIDRDAMMKRYGNLFTELERLFYEEDPMRIVYGEQFEKYCFEVETILPRLSKEAKRKEDVQRILDEEFSSWFDGGICEGNLDRVRAMTLKVWELWCTYPEFHEKNISE